MRIKMKKRNEFSISRWYWDTWFRFYEWLDSFDKKTDDK